MEENKKTCLYCLYWQINKSIKRLEGLFNWYGCSNDKTHDRLDFEDGSFHSQREFYFDFGCRFWKYYLEKNKNEDKNNMES